MTYEEECALPGDIESYRCALTPEECFWVYSRAGGVYVGASGPHGQSVGVQLTRDRALALYAQLGAILHHN